MEHKDTTDILKIIDAMGLFSQIDTLTIKELREHLAEKGYCSLSDLVTISMLVFSFLTGKGMVVSKDMEWDTEMIEATFHVKYKLTKEEIETLTMIAKGLTNQEIADQLDTIISIEGVAKRVRSILVKLKVSNRIQASVKAAKEGLI